MKTPRRYAVKELFLTVQGEGANAGRAAVFLRFAGCNLWSGREEDRAAAPGSCARWCDTDFVGTDGERGGNYTADELAAAALEAAGPVRFLVATGGEPLLQLDNDLAFRLKLAGFEIAVETNGTRKVPGGVAWVTFSPKAGQPAPAITRCDELKVIFPQAGLDLEELARFPARHRFIQPMDGPKVDEHTAAAVAYCLKNPVWRLSVQAHKFIGVR